MALSQRVPLALRQTGIDALGETPWGSHICFLYEAKLDLIETNASYFKEGLRQNEFCLWVVSDPLTIEEAREALAQRIPEFEKYEAMGRIEVASGQEWYLNEGEFNPSRLDERWQDNIWQALDRGFDGVRASGNAFWLASRHFTDFLEYERRLDETLAGKNIIVLCTYPIQGSSGHELVSVAHAHKVALTRRNDTWQSIHLTEISSQPNLLTEREREVIGWVARGKSAWEVGEILDITKRTVDEHANAVIRKLGASNRAEAVAIAVRNRIVDI